MQKANGGQIAGDKNRWGREQGPCRPFAFDLTKGDLAVAPGHRRSTEGEPRRTLEKDGAKRVVREGLAPFKTKARARGR